VPFNAFFDINGDAGVKTVIRTSGDIYIPFIHIASVAILIPTDYTVPLGKLPSASSGF
jgi:hypothetical protein